MRGRSCLSLILLVTLLSRKSRCGFRSSCTQSERSLGQARLPQGDQRLSVDFCDGRGEAAAEREDDFLEHGEGLAAGVLVSGEYVGGQQVFDACGGHEAEGVLGLDQAFEERDEDGVEGDFWVTRGDLLRPGLLSSRA